MKQLSLFPNSIPCSQSEHKKFSKPPQLKRVPSKGLGVSGASRKRLEELRDNIRSILGMNRKGVAVLSESGAFIGESSPVAKYTDHEVLLCMDLRLEGYSLLEISQKMDIPIRTIRDFFSGKRRATTPMKFISKKPK